MRIFRTFGFLLTLAVTILFAYWVGMGLINLDFMAAASLGPRVRLLSLSKDGPPTSRHSSLVSDTDAPVDQLPAPGNGGAADPSHADPGSHAAKAEERHIPRQEENVHQTRLAPKLLQRQERRLQVLRDACASESIWFPHKNRSFEDIPNEELENLIVDDRHGIIYCYVPKVACTNWKRVMIILTESLLKDGVPERNPLAVPGDQVHNPDLFFTMNEFPERYGKVASQLMEVKLQKYTKFLFVRDPFVRIISAFRDKFQGSNDYYYKTYGKLLLRLYGNQPTPPENISESIKMGIRPTFHHFVQFLTDPQTEKKKPVDGHWQQVHRLCHPCQIQYDFVGHLETLDEDAEHLLRLLRVDDVVKLTSVGNRKVSESSWVSDWFKGIPVDQLRKLYQLFEPDFRLFGYPRPDFILND